MTRPRAIRTTKKPHRENGGAFEKALMFTEDSVAQLDRPAEAGMMVPVVMREAKHLP
jgi:hypothetical protein